MYEDILEQVDHRQSPLPKEPWLMRQHWKDLIFLHFPIEVERIRPYIPKGLEADRYKGMCWISVVPFYIKETKVRLLPVKSFIKPSLQLNIRTYVKYKGRHCVYFCRIYTDQLLSMIGGRYSHLPFVRAQLSGDKKDSCITYTNQIGKGYDTRFKLNFRLKDESLISGGNDTLSHWLLERYELITAHKGNLYHGIIHHKKWQVKQGNVSIDSFLLPPFLSENILTIKPVVHYAPEKTAFIWRVKPLT